MAAIFRQPNAATYLDGRDIPLAVRTDLPGCLR
jgi:hypothetical protein